MRRWRHSKHDAAFEPCGLLRPQRAAAQLDSDQPVRLGPLHYLRMRLMDDLYEAAMSCEDLDTALEAATALLPYYRAIFPKVWFCALSVCRASTHQMPPKV